MNRTSFKNFTRAGMSMTTIAISIASALALSGCGSTGGSLSKTDGSGVATNGSKGTASGSNGTSASAGTSPTNTGTDTGVTPSASARQASNSAWDSIVGGVGNVVMQSGDTVSAVGTTLAVPGVATGAPVSNALSGILTGTGGAVYGVGQGATSGLEGIANGTDPVDALVHGLGKTSALAGQGVSTGGYLLSATGATMPYSSYFSPAFVAVGSGLAGAGANLSSLQFDAASTLTDSTVQQLTAAVAPLVYPVATSAIELGSEVGNRTGLGGPLNTLITQTGDAVATLGVGLGSSSTSPVVQQLGGTVIATGDTVAALGGVVHDGQSSAITPISVTSTSVNSILQGATVGLADTPGGSGVASTLSGLKAGVSPTLGAVVNQLSTSASPAASALASGTTVISTTVSAVAAPIVAISTTLSGSVNGATTTTSQSGSLVPMLSPVVLPPSTLVSNALATVKGDSAAPSLSATLAHPGH